MKDVNFSDCVFDRCTYPNSFNGLLWGDFSPKDSKYIAIGDTNGKVYVWKIKRTDDSVDLKVYRVYEVAQNWIWTIRFSPNQKYLLVGGDEQ
ncbi:MAG: hypothetical protein AAFY76_10835, partial [Cyanobacteria bacterium J06649_11]